MDKALTQRLIGAAVLIALAVIFLPMLLKPSQSPSPVSEISQDIPTPPPADAPPESRDIPLGTPGEVPAGGVAGMDLPVAKTEQDAHIEPAPQPVTRAAGDHAVHFGSYASQADANTVLEALHGVQLPAYSEAVTHDGQPAFRVRIGPFASRADAEAARIKANALGSSAKPVVITLNASQPTQQAPAAAARPAATKTEPASTPRNTSPVTPSPAQPSPPRPAASNVGFAVQLGAFSNAADATALRNRARAAGLSAFTETINTEDGTLTRVRLGPVADRNAAEQLKAEAAIKLGTSGMVRPHP